MVRTPFLPLLIAAIWLPAIARADSPGEEQVLEPVDPLVQRSGSALDLDGDAAMLCRNVSERPRAMLLFGDVGIHNKKLVVSARDGDVGERPLAPPTLNLSGVATGVLEPAARERVFART